MPSKPVAQKEEDSLVSAPSLTRLSSLAELQRDTPAATRAISDGFNYATKSIVSNPLVIAVPTLAIALINYFAHQIFPFGKVQYNFNTTNIRELITFYTASNSSTIPNEVQVLKLFSLAVAVWTWIGFYHNSWVEKSCVNDLRGKPNNSAKYFSVCAYNFPGKIGLIFGFIKHQVATIALWFGASYAIFALFDYAVSRRDWQIMQNLNVKNALGFFCFLTVASVVFHVLSHVVLPGVLASMIASNDDINGLDAVKRAIKLADRTRSHETIFIVIVLMTFFAFGASFFNIVILDPLIANLSIAQKYKDILESFLDGLTFAYYYACFSYALASIYLHINGSSARASAPVRSNPPVAAAPASSSKKSSSKSPARSRASSSSKKRTPSKSKSPKK